MAYPNTIDSPSTSMQGTTLVATDDHAQDHRVFGSAVIAIENKLGIGVGSALANQLLVGTASGTSTWQQTWNNGTLGSASIGTSSMIGGTVNGVALGTGLLTKLGSDATGDLYYNNGGTLNRLAIGANGNFLTTNGTTPSWGTVNTALTSFATIVGADGTTASTGYVNMPNAFGTITAGANGKALLYFRGEGKNNSAAQNLFIAYTIDGGTTNFPLIAIDLDQANASKSMNLSCTTIVTGLSAASHTLQITFKTSAGTATILGTASGTGYEAGALAL